MHRQQSARLERVLAPALVAFAFGLAAPTNASAQAATTASASGSNASTGFVARKGGQLTLNGNEFGFGAVNNYYVMYKDAFMVDDVLTAAQSGGFTVLRTWGFEDIGNQDGSNSVGSGKADGVVYFQYWNGTAPAYNDGADGLSHLDYVIYRAGQLGLKLVIPLVNNWKDFGGMDQYVAWRQGQYHDQFYTDPTILGWYEQWITHVLTHVNSYTGVAYMNDPTIMTWELGNEPRCTGSGVYPSSGSCTTKTITSWADTVSRFIKFIDPKHLVSAGDEGFLCIPGTTDWTTNCSQGVDSVALANLKSMDVMSLHLYPDYWGETTDWGTAYFVAHIAAGKVIQRPVFLGEFGVLSKLTRNTVYKTWTDAALLLKASGASVWMLGGKQDNGNPVPNYDGFQILKSDPVFSTLSNFAVEMTAGKFLKFAPVTDNIVATTPYATPVTVNAAGTAVAYRGAVIVPGSIDS